MVQLEQDLEAFVTTLDRSLKSLELHRDQDREALKVQMQALKTRLDQRDREALFEKKLKEATR